MDFTQSLRYKDGIQILSAKSILFSYQLLVHKEHIYLQNMNKVTHCAYKYSQGLVFDHDCGIVMTTTFFNGIFCRQLFKFARVLKAWVISKPRTRTHTAWQVTIVTASQLSGVARQLIYTNQLSST